MIGKNTAHYILKHKDKLSTQQLSLKTGIAEDDIYSFLQLQKQGKLKQPHYWLFPGIVINKTIDNIIAQAALEFDVDKKELISRRRGRAKISNARFVAMLVIKDILNYRVSIMCRVFKRDHSTIIKTMAKARVYLKNEDGFRSHYNNVLSKFNQ